jgi:hypothetical protein
MPILILPHHPTHDAARFPGRRAEGGLLSDSGTYQPAHKLAHHSALVVAHHSCANVSTNHFTIQSAAYPTANFTTNKANKTTNTRHCGPDRRDDEWTLTDAHITRNGSSNHAHSVPNNNFANIVSNNGSDVADPQTNLFPTSNELSSYGMDESYRHSAERPLRSKDVHPVAAQV